jgi:hypothetical protein
MVPSITTINIGTNPKDRIGASVFAQDIDRAPGMH